MEILIVLTLLALYVVYRSLHSAGAADDWADAMEQELKDMEAYRRLTDDL